jgi:hypothetical protein
LVQRLTLTIPADAAGPLALDVSLFDPVRVRDDGTPGINAIFHIAYAQGGIDYTPIIAIFPPE